MLTSQAAAKFALKDAPKRFTNTEIELIKGFTPEKVTDDKQNWSAQLMNYYFCLGMVKINPFIAISLMDEAGVNHDSIEYALIVAGLERAAGGEFIVHQTNEPIAPPTFSNDPAKWLKRGYPVDAPKLQAGDVCVLEGDQVVGFRGDDEKIVFGVPGERIAAMELVFKQQVKGWMRV